MTEAVERKMASQFKPSPEVAVNPGSGEEVEQGKARSEKSFPIFLPAGSRAWKVSVNQGMASDRFQVDQLNPTAQNASTHGTT